MMFQIKDWTLLIPVISLGSVYLAVYVIGPSSIRKAYRTNPAMTAEITYVFTEEKLTITWADKNEEHFWTDLLKYYEEKDMILLRFANNKKFLKIIPKTAFKSDDELNTFRSTYLVK